MIVIESSPRMTSIAEFGGRFAALRLCEPAALDACDAPLERHGQFTRSSRFLPTAINARPWDGFQAPRAARALGWPEMAVTIADLADGIEAKVRLAELHPDRGLTELEQGWLVRSLYRDNSLSQSELARRLDRQKSWGCR